MQRCCSQTRSRTAKSPSQSDELDALSGSTALVVHVVLERRVDLIDHALAASRVSLLAI